MSSISAHVNEYLSIKEEIKANNQKNKQLRQRQGELEVYIKDYMRVNNHPGLRYQGKAIMLQTSERKVVKRKRS